MAEVNVTIKTNEPIGSGARFLAQNIGTSIDVPNNIAFVDGKSSPTAINRIMLAADGTVMVRPFGGLDANKYSQYFVKGGWHKTEPIGYIYGSNAGTTAALGIRVRWED